MAIVTPEEVDELLPLLALCAVFHALGDGPPWELETRARQLLAQYRRTGRVNIL